VSSTSDLSASNKRIRKKTTASSSNLATIETNVAVSVASSGTIIAKHSRNTCLLCCRTRILNNIVDSTFKTSLNIQEPKDLGTQNSNSKIRESEVLFYSPESIVSDDSANTSMPDKISNTILRNVRKMANPIMYKSCRKILIELKQKYPQSFQDLCLYSEICKYMAQCSYRVNTRRFIQEIFLDLKFDIFDNNIDSILEAAGHRFSSLNLLDSSRNFPTSPLLKSKLPGIQTVPSTSIPITLHKLSTLKSPLLASVYETSIENLMDSPPKLAKDEVDAVISVKLDELKLSASGEKIASTQVIAEIHLPSRNGNKTELSSSSQNIDKESLRPIRRGRFNTLELDLSCTKNKFPIKNRSPTGPSATSTLQRPVSLNANTESQQPLFKSLISTSDHSFESSCKAVTSPISPMGKLFCEQRLLTSSRSEATLSNKRDDVKIDTDDDTKKKIDKK
jgi:rapamycin-insensitive companion of mTOR